MPTSSTKSWSFYQLVIMPGVIMKKQKKIIWRKYHALDNEVYRAESGHLVASYFFAVVFLAKVNCWKINYPPFVYFRAVK